MKTNRKVVVAIVFTAIAISAFVAVAFFLPIPLGAPAIGVELSQTPPWHIRPGESLQVGLNIANGAWLLAVAKDVKVSVDTPEGLTVSGTNTDEYQIDIGTLRGGESRNYAFNIIANVGLLPGTYTITIKMYGENVSQKTITPEIVAELPQAQ